jgi:hypothetical protein
MKNLNYKDLDKVLDTITESQYVVKANNHVIVKVWIKTWEQIMNIVEFPVRNQVYAQTDEKIN